MSGVGGILYSVMSSDKPLDFEGVSVREAALDADGTGEDEESLLAHNGDSSDDKTR